MTREDTPFVQPLDGAAMGKAAEALEEMVMVNAKIGETGNVRRELGTLRGFSSLLPISFLSVSLLLRCARRHSERSARGLSLGYPIPFHAFGWWPSRSERCY